MFGNKGTTWADLGISKTFMDNRLTVSFTIDNIFDNGGFQMKRTKPVDSGSYAYAEEISDVFNIPFVIHGFVQIKMSACGSTRFSCVGLLLYASNFEFI